MVVEVTEAVANLISLIAKEIKDNIAADKIAAELDQYYYWKVDGFAYTDKGVSYTHMSGAYTNQKNWLRAQMILLPIIKESAEFKNLVGVLRQFCPLRTTPEADAARVVYHLMDVYFTRKQAEYTGAFASILYRLINDLHDEPQKISVQLNLEGITIGSRSIQLTPTATLRQTLQSDIEIPKEVSMRVSGMYHDTHNHPSAILETEFELSQSPDEKSLRPIDLQGLIIKYVVMLRLYAVGSVDYLSYSMNCNAILPNTTIGGVVSYSNKESSFIKYYVPSEDEQRLIEFMRLIDPLVPKDLYHHEKKTTFLTIAYDRYSDALLEKGIFEKRVSNAVMGLEAIYSNENLELAYKLRQRIAKTMSHFGKQPIDLLDVVKDAYAIRSTFAHGGLSEKKDRNRILKRYISDQNFIISILDVLRISIVACIRYKLEKEIFIKLLDEAMIDEAKGNELQELLTG